MIHPSAIAVARWYGPFVQTKTSMGLRAATGCESGVFLFPQGKKTDGRADDVRHIKADAYYL
jgi:hypothetical protein